MKIRLSFKGWNQAPIDHQISLGRGLEVGLKRIARELAISLSRKKLEEFGKWGVLNLVRSPKRLITALSLALGLIGGR